MKTHFILFVSNQKQSAEFYSAVLGQLPSLDVPGMTEFNLGESAVLGLMPEGGIVRLLGSAVDHPSSAGQVPRAEVYLEVADAAVFHARAVAYGARELSPLLLRDWGHHVAYSLDPDGYVLAFASLPEDSKSPR